MDDDIVRTLGKPKAVIGVEMYYLYVIRNKVNGRKYYGITRDVMQRWYTHRHQAKRRSTAPLYYALRRYGVSNFDLYVLASDVDEAFIANAEIEQIAADPNCYNLHKGGYLGFDVRTKGPKATAEWRAKMCVARQGRTPALGTKHTEETKKLCGQYGKLRWDIYGRYPKEVLDLSFAEANKKFGISKTHYYRLRRQK